MTNSGGVSFFVNYDKFRISDEFSDYNLTSLGEYSGNVGKNTEGIAKITAVDHTFSL